MRVIEVVASAQVRRNLGNYESEEHFASVKVEVGDTPPAEALDAAHKLAIASLAGFEPGSVDARAEAAARRHVEREAERAKARADPAQKPPGKPPEASATLQPGGLPVSAPATPAPSGEPAGAPPAQPEQRTPPPQGEKAAPVPRAPEPVRREPAGDAKVRVFTKGFVLPALIPKLQGLGLALQNGRWEAIMSQEDAGRASAVLRTQKLQYGMEVV